MPHHRTSQKQFIFESHCQNPKQNMPEEWMIDTSVAECYTINSQGDICLLTSEASYVQQVH